MMAWGPEASTMTLPWKCCVLDQRKKGQRTGYLREASGSFLLAVVMVNRVTDLFMGL